MKTLPDPPSEYRPGICVTTHQIPSPPGQFPMPPPEVLRHTSSPPFPQPRASKELTSLTGITSSRRFCVTPPDSRYPRNPPAPAVLRHPNSLQPPQCELTKALTAHRKSSHPPRFCVTTRPSAPEPQKPGPFCVTPPERPLASGVILLKYGVCSARPGPATHRDS
jgi:hypothetical protein